MKTIDFYNSILSQKKLVLLRAQFADVPDVRRLVNRAYKPLGEQGLNYTAVDQDEVVTWDRMQKGDCFLIRQNLLLVATVTVSVKNEFTGTDSLYVSQLAVDPEFKGAGLGRMLMEFCEDWVLEMGHSYLQLDTAIPATDLVQWYQRRGYQIVGTTHWDGKTYDSYIFEKKISAEKVSTQ